jgi:hypothetical protein
MTTHGARVQSYQTAEQRWAGVGPYYAMFPSAFADDVVQQHTAPGDTVLDPFAGRGTSVFSAASQGRKGVGIELNAVGWLYASAKLEPASRGAVEDRIRELGGAAADYGVEGVALPPFFSHCFSLRVRQFLCAARDLLRWRKDRTDRTLMALLLVYLHGKREASLSNQMRQTKSLAPDYAIRWWKERSLKPPAVDPVEFMVRRLDWRYAKGLPKVTRSRVYLGDSTSLLPEVGRRIRKHQFDRPQLLLTSPPYFAVTNYHYDQWLRLWLLGGPPHARRVSNAGDHRDKFENLAKYQALLVNVFARAAELLRKDAVVYVRTGKREETYSATVAALKDAFPKKRLHVTSRPFLKPTQTHLFGDVSEKDGEADLVLRPA